MKKSFRFVPFSVAVSLLLVLLFVVPLFAVEGTVKILQTADLSKDATFSRQGGGATLEVVDKDLDVAVKRVIVDGDIATTTAANITAGSAVITATAANVSTTVAMFSVGDTVLVYAGTTTTVGSGIETVRKVVSVDSPATTTPTITVDKAFRSTVAGATVGIVTSAAVLASACSQCAYVEPITIAQQGAAGNKFLTLTSIPVQDSNVGGAFVNRVDGAFADTIVNQSDVMFVTGAGAAIGGLTILSLSPGSGLATVVDDGSAPLNFFALYWGSDRNDTESTVKVTSQADPSGVTAELIETGPTTAKFRANVNFVDTFSSITTTPRQLKVGQNDLVTMKYTDASPSKVISKSITIETTPAAFSNLEPTHDTAGTDATPLVKAFITDADSGVVKTNLKVVFAVDNDGDSVIDDSVEADLVDSGRVDTVTGGFSIERRLPSANRPTADGTIYWWVKSSDNAGNPAVTDRLPTISNAQDDCDAANFPTVAGLLNLKISGDAADSAAVAGCQAMAIKVDFTEPDMTQAFTGEGWDVTNKAIKLNVKTSIRAVFSESVDVATVQASDFTVDGIIPLTAELFSSQKDSVFLTVGEMAPNARPKVQLVGEIKDVAGNRLTTDTVDPATDKIDPTLTVTVTGTGADEARPVTKDKVTISVVTDEDVGTPAVSIWQVGGGVVTTTAGDLIGAGASDPVAKIVTMVLKAPRTYEGTFTPPRDGLYNLYASAKDANTQNEGTKGITAGTAGADIDLAKAILFELDSAVEAPGIGPATTDDPDTFITIDFVNEGKEYGLDSDIVFTSDVAKVVTSYDKHGTVTIVSATLGGVDISGDLATTDNVKFLYKAFALEEKDHTVKVKVKDLAGTETEFTGTVKVTARKKFAVTLKPGWNIISLPGSPSDGDINAVIPSTHPISSVLSYDPSLPGGWLAAVRDPDTGRFVGSLTTITASRGYWVLTNSFQSLDVSVPSISAGLQVLPPTVSLVEGWNLIPVLDVTGKKASGSTIDSKAYLGTTIKVARIYSFDTIGNEWKEKTFGGTGLADDLLTFGEGYWIYVTADATLVP